MARASESAMASADFPQMLFSIGIGSNIAQSLPDSSNMRNFILTETNDLAGFEIQTPADTTICKRFQNTAFMFTKTNVKVRNRTDCTTAFCRLIATVYDLRPAVNRQPGYRRVDSQSGRT